MTAVSPPPGDDRGRQITGVEARRIADEVLRENEQRRLPPADDQAELAAAAYACTAEADPELTGYYELSPHSLRSTGWALHGAGWATPDEARALRARVAAVRALADEMATEEFAAAGSYPTSAGALGTPSMRIRAVLDGPVVAPADPHLSEWQTQMRGFLGKRVEVVLNKDPRKVVVGVLHHFDTDGQVYVEDEDGSWGWAWPCLDIAEAAGPTEAAEPPATRPDVYVRMAESRAVRTFEPAYGVAIDVDTNGDVVGVEMIGAVGVEINGQRIDAGSVTTTVPPEPGYPRIADAITAACEAADIDLTVVHDGRVLDYVPGVVWLATVLDKAGLIDWAAFQDEAGNVAAPEPRPPTITEAGDAVIRAAIHWAIGPHPYWDNDNRLLGAVSAYRAALVEEDR